MLEKFSFFVIFNVMTKMLTQKLIMLYLENSVLEYQCVLFFKILVISLFAGLNLKNAIRICSFCSYNNVAYLTIFMGFEM